jgi:hypothetical protein
MKNVILGILAGVLLVAALGAKKVERDYSKYLAPINDPNWVKVYGDGKESQLYYNIVLLRVNQNAITRQADGILTRLDARISTLERQIVGLGETVGSRQIYDSNEITEVNWLGYPVFTTKYQGIDPGMFAGGPPLTILAEEGTVIGLRKDGVVVWKGADPNEKLN